MCLIPKNIENDELKFTVCNYLIILVCSFLDEWKRFEGLGKDPEIETTLRISSPALRRIRIWSGLHKFRSKILADSSRESSGETVWPWDGFGFYDAPTSYAEIMLLANCSVKSIDIAVSRHNSDYVNAAAVMDKLDKNIVEKGIRNIREISSALKSIDAEIGQNARAAGLDFAVIDIDDGEVTARIINQDVDMTSTKNATDSSRGNPL